jgi:hypothetical protein
VDDGTRRRCFAVRVARGRSESVRFWVSAGSSGRYFHVYDATDAFLGPEMASGHRRYERFVRVLSGACRHFFNPTVVSGLVVVSGMERAQRAPSLNHPHHELAPRPHEHRASSHEHRHPRFFFPCPPCRPPRPPRPPRPLPPVAHRQSHPRQRQRCPSCSTRFCQA